MTNRFDLEQDLLSLWAIKEDLAKFHWMYVDSPDGPMTEDEVSNMIMAIENILDLRMHKTWHTFCKAYEIDGYRKMKQEIE
jgi:hypothetical protein